MKPVEIRDKTVDELDKNLLALKEEYFHLRMKKAAGAIEKTHRFKEVRRDRARIATIIKEKNRRG